MPPGLDRHGRASPRAWTCSSTGCAAASRGVAPDQLRARLSLAGAQAGEVTLRVLPEHITVPPGITVLRINPSRIRVTLAAPSSPSGEPRKEAPLMSRLFGTDGIRGVANQEPLTTELAFRLGRQLVATLLDHHGVKQGPARGGRDTRLSGPMLEGALVSGALSAGADVYTVGVLPTPAIAFLTRRLEAHGGVVLSASHNPFAGQRHQDLLLGRLQVPRCLGGRDRGPPCRPRRGAQAHGRGDRAHPAVQGGAEADYVDTRAPRVPLRPRRHDGGARLRPRRDVPGGAPGLPEPGRPRHRRWARRPDGRNINQHVGRAAPGCACRRRVLAARAHLGVAFDGDGDRLISVDERGEIRDGDYALAICGRHMASTGRLNGGVVVTTVMANLGLDKALRDAGVRTVKTQVGDRYVLEEMQKVGANLGGEQSGHLLFLDHATTGDGIAVRAAPAERHAGDGATALRAVRVHGQVSPGARQRRASRSGARSTPFPASPIA